MCFDLDLLIMMTLYHCLHVSISVKANLSISFHHLKQLFVSVPSSFAPIYWNTEVLKKVGSFIHLSETVV